jgi:hypothetical protein
MNSGWSEYHVRKGLDRIQRRIKRPASLAMTNLPFAPIRPHRVEQQRLVGNSHPLFLFVVLLCLGFRKSGQPPFREERTQGRVDQVSFDKTVDLAGVIDVEAE